MKRYLEVEVDDDMIKESGLDADDYIRQEMGWMEESGFILCDVISEDPAAKGMLEYHPPYGGTELVEPYLDVYQENNNLYVGLAYLDPEYGKQPYADVTVNVGRLPYLHAAIDTNNNGEKIVDFLTENGFGALTDQVMLSGYCEYPVFKFSEEALGKISPRVFGEYQKANHIETEQAKAVDGIAERLLDSHAGKGNEGIYLLGEKAARTYIANAFWSREHPGDVSFSVLASGDGAQKSPIAQGVMGGFASIEDCVQHVAKEFTPIDAPSPRFVAECTHSVDSIDYCQKAIGEKLGRPPTFYFSFGANKDYPFQEGWVEVKAADLEQAKALFRSHFPDKRPGLLNCAFVYTAQEWQQTSMAKGAPSQICHQIIDAAGHYRRDMQKEKPLSSLVEKAKARMAKRVERAASNRRQPEQER